MTPGLDAALRALPLDTKEEAQAFMRAFKSWLWENNPYGMGAMMLKSAKPACVRAPDIFRRAKIAEELAEQCYWQMPYAEARVRFPGLPESKWKARRELRGLP